MSSASEIKDVLTKYTKVAIVGISPDPSRPSHTIANYLIGKGYDVCGVRPGTSKILGRPCYESLKDVPPPLEIVDVFRNSDAVPGIVDELSPLGAKVLWLQEGVMHPEAEEKARRAGIIVISDL
ncbi:MAG: CoA-binding protein, partial [Bacteriovoracaceae bacterium]|nr:CoA-binding protein [Bacteriovoracaceae bacterium]